MQKNQYPFGEKIVRTLLLLGANDKYKAEMKRLSKTYNPPSSENQIINGKEELEFLKSPQCREMTKEYLKIMDKYGLAALFDFLINYLFEKGHLAKAIQGKNIKVDARELVSDLLLSSGIKVVDKKKEYVTLNIYADTTIKDIQKNWPEIKKALNKGNDRKKGSTKLERNLKVLSLKNKGLKAKKIADEINSDPEFSNQKITYQEVSRIVKRLKTKAQKNMPRKDS
ncbi:MAG: hypothetical protein RBS77_04875 [Candidatus Moranbacteria bacterium]|jgi:hypothetical protein|nr:hypothetical protein [Candidatus Moranbacteria bacterium]